jgi:osmotically inducible protein OsmC
MQPVYTAIATTEAGRGGRAKSDDGTLDLQLAVPKGLGGPGGPGTNPEQLFAAGYSACFGGAMAMVAGQKKIKLPKVSVTAKVHIGKEGPGFGLAVELIGHFNGMDPTQAQELMEATHQACPYSKATRGNIEVKLSVA